LSIAQQKLTLDENNGAVYYRRIEAEQQTANGGHHRRQIDVASGTFLQLLNISVLVRGKTHVR